MKWRSLILGAVLHAAARAEDAPGTTLRWNNGESIKGRIAGASATELKWKSPLFDEPLELRWSALRRIDTPRAALPITDTFGFALRDGSFIHGDLVSVKEKTITMRSARHGEVVLDRPSVLAVRRLRGGDLLYGGPMGDIGWHATGGDANTLFSQILAPGNNAPPVGAIDDDDGLKKKSSQSEAVFDNAVLTVGAGGVLSMPFWNTGGKLDVTVPERADVEFRIRSTKRPDFVLTLGGESVAQRKEGDQERRTARKSAGLFINSPNPPEFMTDGAGKAEHPLRVETWGDELVLALGDDFQVIRKIADDEREMALRLCWDAKARVCSVFTPEGEPLIEWRIPGEAAVPPPGIVLENKGGDLSLELLRVRKWNGKPPAKVDSKLPRIELADGRVIAGEVGESSGTTLHLHPRGADAAMDVPLAKVDAMILSTEAPQTGGQAVSLNYADGTLLKGRLSSIKDDRATLQLPFQEHPLDAKLDDLRRMRIAIPAPPDAQPEPPLAEFDKIDFHTAGKTQPGVTLRGKMIGTGENQPHWLPVGGAKPVTLAKGFSGEILRAQPANTPPPTAPALAFTTGGDVLPGSLHAITRTEIEFESDIVEERKFPADGLHAIQFNSSTRKSLSGFSDPGWKILKGDEKTVRKAAGTLGLDPETAVAHPDALLSSEVALSVSSTGSYSAVRLRLFCAGTNAEKSTSFVIARWPNGIQAGLETEEGNLANAVRINAAIEGPVAIHLLIGEQGVELTANGKEKQLFPIPLEKRAGVGLVIEPANAFGNEASAISISGFSTQATSALGWLAAVASETKMQTLTVPRFRKDDPPRHALIGMNGDVLRGEIEAVTANHLGFRSGLENLRVPRDRVNAVVWLRKPDPAAPPVAVENPVLKLLEQPMQHRGDYQNAGFSDLTGFLLGEDGALKYKLPEKQGSRRASMEFKGQTIREALEEICSLMEVRYRIADDGTIIIEEMPALPQGMESKTYPLKADALSKAAPAEEFLKAKGLALPAGATLSWQADSRQLTMVNTPENHAKLAAILDAEFGGAGDLPTHWLVLTDGARLGLKVDRFDADTVSGRHPLYGRCTVPLARIHRLSTFAPEMTPAMKSLRDWRLVFAPEPVLPETGGESSPMLGKEAKAFKLPLLGEGEFDLAKEQGKVVVLDFWATWCGPCIKSLPDLIGAMSAFPAERVKLIGMNQAEPAGQVKRFIETRGWKFTVAMDAKQEVAKQFGVDGIPHTVIIGPDGKVAWVKTGYSPDGAAEAAAKVKALLGTP